MERQSEKNDLNNTYSAVYGKRSYLDFFKIRFFYILHCFAFSIMSKKISLLGSVVSEIEMSYLHFKSKFTRK